MFKVGDVIYGDETGNMADCGLHPVRKYQVIGFRQPTSVDRVINSLSVPMGRSGQENNPVYINRYPDADDRDYTPTHIVERIED